MHKNFYGFFILLFVFSTIYGNVPNTDLEEAILYSDLASVKRILSTTKSFNAQEQKAYLILSGNELERRKRLLNCPRVYRKIAPTDMKSKALFAMTILSGIASLSLIVGWPLIEDMKLSVACLMGGTMGLLITPMLIIASDSYEIDRCSSTAHQYYKNAQMINSLLNKVSLSADSISLLTYNQTELNANIRIDVA